MLQNFLQPALIRKKVRKEEREKLTDASQIFNCEINLTKLQNTHRDPCVMGHVPYPTKGILSPNSSEIF